MAIKVDINFDKIYDVDPLSQDLKISEFQTELQNGKSERLKIEISNQPEKLLPSVYNFAFGPMNQMGHIDDRAELAHKDHSKVFSTILFTGLTYLNNNPEHYLGVDGSDNVRAVFYYRFLQRNYRYLSQFFDMYGIKYYVRISRMGKRQYDNPFDFEDINAVPAPIHGATPLSLGNLYNYFIFNKKP